MSRPVWLLDFDGVINALSSRGGKSVWDTWRTARITDPENFVGSYPLLWSPAVVSTVALAVDCGVDVRWLTTWKQHTVLLPAVVEGLPNGLPWISDDGIDIDSDKHPQRWKPFAARAAVSDDAPLLWTDDCLDYILTTDDRSWLRTRRGGSTLIVPRGTIGLSQRNIREINEWIGGVAS